MILPGPSGTVSVTSGNASLSRLWCARGPDSVVSSGKVSTLERTVSGTSISVVDGSLAPRSFDSGLCDGDSASEAEAVITISGTASALRFSYASVPGISPWLGTSMSTFSTIVRGIGDPPGVKGSCSRPTVEELLLRDPSGITSISSGTASCSLNSYARVPGTSPCEGISSTFSTRVSGTGDVRPDAEREWARSWPSLASEKCSSSLFVAEKIVHGQRQISLANSEGFGMYHTGVSCPGVLQLYAFAWGLQGRTGRAGQPFGH
jgi:hypothetical protein